MNKTIGLIVALSITIGAVAQEKLDEAELTNTSDASDSAPVLISQVPVEGRTIDAASPAPVTVPVTSTPESSPEPLEEALQPQEVPLAPPENPVAEIATEHTDAGVPEASGDEGDKELSFFDRAWDYLVADDNSIVTKGKVMIQKRKFRKKYGKDADSPLNFKTLTDIMVDMEVADELRRQRQLELEIAQAERDKLNNETLECLTLNGFREARRETADQEVATAAAVLNRLSVGFRGATTICEVIFTPKQFSWVEQHGRGMPDLSNPIEKKAWQRSLLIARRMLDPDATYIDPSNGAIYYYNEDYVRKQTGKDWKYAYAYKQVAVLGNHRFMAEKDPNHPHYIDNHQVRINPVLFNGLSHEERKALIEKFQNEGDV